jgi:hypothetical protein
MVYSIKKNYPTNRQTSLACCKKASRRRRLQNITFFFAQENNSAQMYQSKDRVESSFYIVEPFLNYKDRDRIWMQYQQFSKLCDSVLKVNVAKKSTTKILDSFIWYKKFFRTNLYEALFVTAKK